MDKWCKLVVVKYKIEIRVFQGEGCKSIQGEGYGARTGSGWGEGVPFQPDVYDSIQMGIEIRHFMQLTLKVLNF